MCHTFVIGDLVIDHAVYVAETTPNHQQVQYERIFDVLRRKDAAGGAANCTRILALCSTGRTYLWGLLGKSHWGTFRAILEDSQAMDGATSNIELLGAQDETEAKMNTVSRLIAIRTVGGGPVPWFGDRLDETGHLHVSDIKRESILHYLERAHEELRNERRGELDIILINDLDMGCLTKGVVQKIEEFARKNQIPLFVDPKYDANKYRDAEGTAILPNLVEWCRLVGESDDKVDSWKDQVRRRRGLEGMAYRSFRNLGNFEYYIIKCKEQGVIFVGPSPIPGETDRYAIYAIPPHPIDGPPPGPQLGCGDVMTAVFALEFEKIVAQVKPESQSQRTIAALKALVKANAVVACYREMEWHRMPSGKSIQKALEETDANPNYDPSSPSDVFVGKHLDSVRKGMIYLPKKDKIILSDYKTVMPGWYSDTESFREKLQAVRKDCLFGGEQHVIVGAPPGCGKSALIKSLEQEALSAGVTMAVAPNASDAHQAKDEMAKFLRGFVGGGQRQLTTRILAIDEALKKGFDDLKFAVLRLDEAKRNCVRLVLVDTGFATTNFLQDDKNNEITTRCKQYILPGLNERPRDIPFIVAGLVLNDCTHESVEIRGDFLLAFTNAMLSHPNVREWEDPIKQAVDKALRTIGSGKTLQLLSSDLTIDLMRYLDSEETAIAKSFWLSFSRGERQTVAKKSRAARRGTSFT